MTASNTYMKGKLISHSINYKHIIALLDRANLRESMKSISRVNTFKRTSTGRQTRTQREKKTSNGVMDKSFVDNIEATGLMPAPTVESVLSGASSRQGLLYRWTEHSILSMSTKGF